MKSSPRVLILLSDLHVGATAGLLPPGFVTFEGNTVEQNPYQKWLWSCWKDCWKWTHDVIGKDEWSAVVNGDVIDGVHHETREIISSDAADHSSAAVELLKEYLKDASSVYLTEGTNVHVQNSEHGIASSLRWHGVNVVSPNRRKSAWPELDLSIHGACVLVDHHVATSGKSQNASSKFASTVADIRNRRGAAGWRQPQLIVRAHAHEFGIWNDGNCTMVVLPPWQGSTRFGRRVVTRAIPKCGIVIADWRNCTKGEPPVIHHRIHTVDRSNPQFL